MRLDNRVMAIEHGAPFPVPEERRSLRRFLEIGEHHGCQHSVGHVYSRGTGQELLSESGHLFTNFDPWKKERRRWKLNELRTRDAIRKLPSELRIQVIGSAVDH